MSIVTVRSGITDLIAATQLAPGTLDNTIARRLTDGILAGVGRGIFDLTKDHGDRRQQEAA